ncbi:porin [Vibrio albus]|uniref:Porin n=1 Tax=Vibrio albus TaxID=2200953 RepID=A0A2U3BAG2_9VIBR|nr:carbohydrate porin [Vibrio albus]PWI33782.1 porin [Vibrio albus]
MKASGILKLSTLTLLTSMALGAQAGTTVSNEMGTFAISGDVEFNNDVRNTETATTDKTNYDQNGRLLVGVSGMRDVGADNYISANAQILLNMSGDVSADDAWIAMGAKQDWELKLGRFEAYNLFPAGQDTYLNHAAGVDVYTTSYARGRSANGQINLAKTMDKVYFEVSANFMPAGAADDNAVFLRPVVALSLTDSLKLSAGAELNATSDDNDAANDFTGYGATLNYAADSVSVNVSYAAREFDTDDKDDMTYGANAQFGNAFIGYVHAENDGTDSSNDEVNTVYASYKFANVMDVEDLALYLGAYSSETKEADNKDNGARLRVKYIF